MSKRLEALCKLKEVVEANGVVPGFYKREVEGKCKYCVVGHVFQMTDPRILGIIEEEDKTDYGVDDLLFLYLTSHPEYGNIYEKIKDFGLTPGDLHRLQVANDSVQEPYIEGESTAMVLSELADMIEEEEFAMGTGRI